MSSFPTGVTVVTALGAGGAPRGLTCSSLTSVSVAPPTVLVSLTTRSPTLEAALESGCFAVNLLHARADAAARLFATPQTDRFAGVAWRRSGPYGLPHLAEDAFAVADCRVVGELPVGDHTLLLGEVVAVDQAAGRPLLYGLRRFTGWPAAAGEPPP